MEITTAEQNKEKRMKRIEDSLRDLWDNTKRTNIRIIGVTEEEEKKKGTENMEEKFRKLKTFYHEGLNHVGWNKYSRISIEFSNQIICTKKE